MWRGWVCMDACIADKDLSWFGLCWCCHTSPGDANSAAARLSVCSSAAGICGGGTAVVSALRSHAVEAGAAEGVVVVVGGGGNRQVCQRLRKSCFGERLTETFNYREEICCSW